MRVSETVLGELAYFCVSADGVHAHASVVPPIKPSAHFTTQDRTGSEKDSWQNRERMDAIDGKEVKLFRRIVQSNIEQIMTGFGFLDTSLIWS